MTAAWTGLGTTQHDARDHTGLAGMATDADLTAHEADTTAIHGVADTAALFLKDCRFAASTAYKAGQLVLQSGLLYSAKVDFTSGGSFVASDWNLVSPAEVGYAQITSPVTVTAVAGSPQDVAGLSLTVTATGTRPIVVEFEGYIRHSAVATYAIVSMWEGATQISETGWQYAVANVLHKARCSARLLPTAGSHTYKIAFASSSAVASADIVCTANIPAFIRAEQL